ncbi:TonB-dependent receptor [Dyadobacter chenwenxiniae]|uniref:TonB-dependent receptor n=1 Tax=Dyadobacter chenwenxiniae TaxID=2906456 RepID=A0A9X1PFV7_9BACT|nr:TonB-dependent receptor [Dyadobacter chenwenxiniae]MCF0060390.1 TonB-dependent receptor [Dyadobacter chenwenxiniae]UON86121.1 TonB-dependent receptor [Dyadobacter chenwenxiniae]
MTTFIKNVSFILTKRMLLLQLFLFSAAQLVAQNTAIKGKVSDEQGQALPGVSILVKGTNTGTVSDVEGAFSLDATASQTLVFSYIGYHTQEVPINNRTTVDITMATDVKSLTEVVVVGYGTEKRATITGAVVAVQGKDIQQSPAMNVGSSLSGRLPGLVAVTPSGEPGSDNSTLRIRGVNSLGNNDPLVVVDGIPGRSLERLDPNSIESISVLKDASAAIYGAQAANGVILVTTKRGKLGKPEVTLNFNQGWGKPTRLPKLTNAAEYATLQNEIEYYKQANVANYVPKFTEEEIQKFRDGSDPWKYPNTDWYDEVLKPWSGQNYTNVIISGGSEAVKYFVSVGAKSQDGFYQNSANKYKQTDFRSNLDGKINKYITVGFDVTGRMENKNYPIRPAGSIFRMVMRGKPNEVAFWPDGTPGPDIEYGDNPVVVSTDATGYDNDKWYYLQSNIRVGIQIPWVKGLSFSTNSGIDKTFRFQKRFETPWYLYSWDKQTYDATGKPVLVRGKKGFEDARLTQRAEDRLDILINGLLNYETSINNKHNIKVLFGAERRTGSGGRFEAFRRFFLSTSIDELFAGGDAQKDNNGMPYQSARLNYFGRVNYNLKEKYLAEFVWRYDGSYIFPQQKRFGFFPGVSLGWRVSEEDFFKPVEFMNNLKLRASWGQTGNDRIDEYQFLASYLFGRWEGGATSPIRNQNYIFGIDQEHKTLYEARIPNVNVTWEVANQSNIGFETAFLDSRLTLEADYFYNVRSNILWRRNASIPTSAGLTLPRENIGKVANSGFEFNLGWRDEIRDFRYQVSLNGGYQRNKIKFWDESAGVPDYQRSTGFPIPTDPLNPNNDLHYQANGIFRDQAAIDAYPHWDGARPGDIRFEDVNGDGKIDGNDRVRNRKTNIPRFSTGLSLNAQYKGFDLAVLFQGSMGAVQYINTESGEIGNFLKSFYDERWTVDNPDASGPRTFNRSNEYWKNNRNTFFLINTDYVRLKNVQLGYTIPSALTKKIGMSVARIYVSGLNLLTFTPDYKDFDPETANESGQGYPSQKVFNTGLLFTF